MFPIVPFLLASPRELAFLASPLRSRCPHTSSSFPTQPGHSPHCKQFLVDPCSLSECICTCIGTVCLSVWSGLVCHVLSCPVRSGLVWSGLSVCLCRSLTLPAFCLVTGHLTLSFSNSFSVNELGIDLVPRSTHPSDSTECLVTLIILPNSLLRRECGDQALPRVPESQRGHQLLLPQPRQKHKCPKLRAASTYESTLGWQKSHCYALLTSRVGNVQNPQSKRILSGKQCAHNLEKESRATGPFLK